MASIVLQKSVFEFLSKFGRALRPIGGDGNCLFRSLSFCLFDTEDDVAPTHFGIVYWRDTHYDSVVSKETGPEILVQFPQPYLQLVSILMVFCDRRDQTATTQPEFEHLQLL